MNTDALAQVITLARKMNHCFITTVGEDGFPHLATAEKLSGTEQGDEISVTAWFCVQTVINVDTNPLISIVVWDAQEDAGYQLLGKVRQVKELAVMNGYTPVEEEPLPQIERQLLVRVQKILRFSHAPHRDTEIV